MPKGTLQGRRPCVGFKAPAGISVHLSVPCFLGDADMDRFFFILPIHSIGDLWGPMMLSMTLAFLLRSSADEKEQSQVFAGVFFIIWQDRLIWTASTPPLIMLTPPFPAAPALASLRSTTSYWVAHCKNFSRTFGRSMATAHLSIVYSVPDPSSRA